MEFMFLCLIYKKMPKPLAMRIIVLTNVQKYLGCACAGNIMWMVEFAIENSADIKTNNKPLLWASRNGSLDVLKYLHMKGADIRNNNDKAFRLACEYGHFEIVKYLHENGAHIRALNDYSIRVAEINNHTNIVNYLLQNGAFLRHIPNHLDIVIVMCESRENMELFDGYKRFI